MSTLSRVQSLQHSIFWAIDVEKTQILDDISKYPWAKSIFIPLKSRIDLKRDSNGDDGAYCQKGGYSLCYGWASGPTTWLTDYVLGFKVIERDDKVIKIQSHLGDLTFPQGTFPTPMVAIKI